MEVSVLNHMVSSTLTFAVIKITKQFGTLP